MVLAKKKKGELRSENGDILKKGLGIAVRVKIAYAIFKKTATSVFWLEGPSRRPTIPMVLAKKKKGELRSENGDIIKKNDWELQWIVSSK